MASRNKNRPTKADMIQFFDKLAEKSAHIAILGDIMVDEYHTLDYLGHSVEGPIQAAKSHKAPVLRPGGAANLACQMRHLDCQTTLYGLVDAYTRHVLVSSAIQYVSPPTNGLNPIKRRLYVGDQQVFRWDLESHNYGLDYMDLEACCDLLPKTIECDALIYSDYGKGLFNYDFQPHNGITIVDPKNKIHDVFNGCTIFKPNAKEARELSGEDQWRSQAKWFQRRLGCQAVVITQGADGVCGIIGDRMFEHRPAPCAVPSSVIGAGDAFLACLARAVVADYSIEDAAVLAYEFAAKYITRQFNQPVRREDFSKFVSAEYLSTIPDLVFTNGVFDVLHTGHLSTLGFAKSKGKKLVVAVNGDASVKKLKGKYRPINPLRERMEMLSGLEMVDYVIGFEDDTPLEIIKKICPKTLVKGGDYDAKDLVGAEIVQEVFVAPYIKGKSSTSLIQGSRT